MVWHLLAGRVRQVKSAQFMAIAYTDEEIVKLIEERKVLPNDWRDQLDRKRKLLVKGDDGNTFCIIIRPGKVNPLGFSVILTVFAPQLNRPFRLRRYNGSNHTHYNRIEKEEIDGFHIHYATERYQLNRLKPKEEDYAQPTDRYSDLEGAFQCLIDDANFERPQQQDFFRRCEQCPSIL